MHGTKLTRSIIVRLDRTISQYIFSGSGLKAEEWKI